MKLVLEKGGRKVDGRWLWRDLSLEVAPGECLGIYGPSGTGKTLLLRSLAGLDILDEGQVVADGRSLARWSVPEFRSQVVYLHQRPWFSADIVMDELEIPFQWTVHRDRKFSREKVMTWLGEMGRSEDLLDQRTTNLSGGEGQSVALVRALQLDPEILLCDEPTASLDGASIDQWEGLVRSWWEGGEKGLVVVSHNRNQLDRLATKVVELDDRRDNGIF